MIATAMRLSGARIYRCLAALPCSFRGRGAGTVAAASLAGVLLHSCTQEQQNVISRKIQNWTGTNGVLDVFSDGKVMYRFINIDKMTTAEPTSGKAEGPRPYRFGYGVFDANMNYKQDPGENNVYFEISDYGTNYIFYEYPF